MKKLVVLIHGWNSDNVSDMYAADPWSSLIYDVKQKMVDSDWSLFTFHWEQGGTGANTGPIYNFPKDGFDIEGVGNAVVAAVHADQQGHNLAALINQASPNLRRVQLIAHSAGAWVAREAAADILQSNPYVTVQLTLLDPFIPDVIPAQTTGLNNAKMGQLASTAENDRISLLENYFASDLMTFTPTAQSFSWRPADLNQRVDWSVIYYDSHGGPIEFYRDTVYQSIPGNPTPPGLYGIGCPFDYSQVGWLRSLLYTDEIGCPRIATQPQDQSAENGSSVMLTVTASSSHSLSYQWFRNGQVVGGATRATYSFPVSASSVGAYVVKVSYLDENRFVFSDAANVTLAAPTAPTIGSVFPTALLTSSSQQPFQVFGSGFTHNCALLFNGAILSDSSRLHYKSPNEIDYDLIVLSAGNWSVQVTNNGQISNSKIFTVTTQPPTSGTLFVNLSPSSAVSAGAQWQVDGTGFNNSGQGVGYLNPGAHTIGFKPISGYITPAGCAINIVANQQTTTNATYTPVVATSYSLTLSAGNGQVTPSPSGWNGSAYVYTSGSVVQLAAIANSGYHFTGWSGDVSGTANPVSITMNANKAVTANFASGDPNLATISVTIEPPVVNMQGAQWKYNSGGWTNSGVAVNTPLLGANQNYLQFKNVFGWLAPSPYYVTVAGGETTNVTVTYQQDMTPGLLTVTLSPPDAVNAGAHWHVKGTTNGNGSSVALLPGTYSVTFDPVLGWAAPSNRLVTIQPSQTIILAGTYEPPAGKPVIGNIAPPIGPMTGGTVITINGANFTAPANVLIGGQSSSNVAVSSSTQITCLTPPSSVYGSTNVIVQTTNGFATNLNGFAYGLTNANKIDTLASFGGSSFGVAVQGNYAYFGEGKNLLVLDISTPSSPSKVGQITLPGTVRAIALFQQYAYVADQEGGLQIVDISSPTAPAIRGFYANTNNDFTDGIGILGGRAYVATELAGLEIFDLTIPTMPTLLSSTNCGGGEAVVVRVSAGGVFAYLSTGGNVSIIDVSSPRSPVLRGQVGVGSVYSIAVLGNYVYAPTISGNLEVIDVSNPDSPIDVGDDRKPRGSLAPIQ